MTDDDLRAAAETVLANTPVTGESVRTCLVGAAAETLARGVLGPADDDTLVDEAWLRATLPNVNTGAALPGQAYSFICQKNGRWWLTLTMPNDAAVCCPVPATRGAVRKLLAALSPEVPRG